MQQQQKKQHLSCCWIINVNAHSLFENRLGLDPSAGEATDWLFNLETHKENPE